MDSHITTSRHPGNWGASTRAAVSRSLGRLAHEWHDEPTADGGRHPSYDQTDLGPPEAMVQISPSHAVARRTLTWRGMAAETTKVTESCKIEVRFQAPVHLLALFEEGARSDGFTCVEGLPQSALRNYRRKLVFVPSGHEYYDWQQPSGLTRAAYFYFDPQLFESGAGRADLSFQAEGLGRRVRADRSALLRISRSRARPRARASRFGWDPRPVSDPGWPRWVAATRCRGLCRGTSRLPDRSPPSPNSPA
jgi:hypothetical protein